MALSKEQRAHDLAIVYTDYMLKNNLATDEFDEGNAADERTACSIYQFAYDEFLESIK